MKARTMLFTVNAVITVSFAKISLTRIFWQVKIRQEMEEIE